MEQGLIIATKNGLGYMTAVHLTATKSQNTVRVSFRDSFLLLVQRLLKLFTQAIRVVFKAVENFGRKPIMKLCESISECDTAAKGQLDRLVDGRLASSGTSAAAPEGDGTGKTSRASRKCPSK